MLPKASISTLAAVSPFAVKVQDELEKNRADSEGRTTIIFELDELLTPVAHDGESYLVDVLLASWALRPLDACSSTAAYLAMRRKGIEWAFAFSPKRHLHYCHALAPKDRLQDARVWAAKVLHSMDISADFTGLYCARINAAGLYRWLYEPATTSLQEASMELKLPSDVVRGLPKTKEVQADASRDPNKATVARSLPSAAKSANKRKKTVKPLESKQFDRLCCAWDILPPSLTLIN